MACGNARQRLDLGNGDVVDLGDVADGEAVVRDGRELVGVVVSRALKREADLATTAALPSNTLSGVVLTATANGAFPSTMDGVSVVPLLQRILVKDEAAAAKHGIYTLTVAGNVSTPWQSTRVGDADDDADWADGLVVFVKAGTANGKRMFRCTATGAISLGSTSLPFEVYPSSSGGAGDFMADGSVPATGDFDLGGQKITNLDDGAAADDAATVGQVGAAQTAAETHADAVAPIGIVVPWFGPASSIPARYLKLDGAAVSRTTYAALFAILGTTYGAGNGTTTFNLPDAQAAFVKGASADGDLGPAGGSGSTGSAVTGITGGIVNNANRGVTGAPNTSAAQAVNINDPGHTHTVDPPRIFAWWIIRAL